MGSVLRDLPFPLQAFPTREGPDFRSDWCSEGNLPSSLQRFHRAAPAAAEPAGSGDRAQGTAPCSAPFTPQGMEKVSFCCVSHLHVVALPSLPSMVNQSIWWSLEAKQELFSCCLSGQGGSCPLVSVRALPSVQELALSCSVSKGGRWNSALEMVSWRKSVSSDRGVLSEGSIPPAQGCRKVALPWPQGISGSGQGFFLSSG